MTDPLATLTAFLEGESLTPKKVEDQDAYTLAIQGTHDVVTMFVGVEREHDQLLCYVHCRHPVPEVRRKDMAEYLVRANQGLRIGNFELDFDDGEVRFKSSLDYEGIALNETLIGNAVRPALSSMNTYYPGLMAVAEGILAPDAAVSQVEAKTLTSWPPGDLNDRLAAALGSGDLGRVEALVRLARQGGETGDRTTLAFSVAGVLADLEPAQLEVAGRLALQLGALVEAGAEADSLAGPFVRALSAAAVAVAERADDPGALEAGRQFELAAAAILSVCPEALTLAQADTALCAAALALRWKRTFLHRLTRLLDEELLVLHVDGWGARVRISGVSSNGQLHGLLAHHLHGVVEGASWEPPAAEVVECLSGEGPPEVPALVSGAWTLCHWTGAGPQAGTEHWLWKEGVPDDVMRCPLLGGVRVVLLRQAIMNSGIDACRDFEELLASVEVTGTLSPEAAQQALSTLAAVSAADRDAAIAANEARTLASQR